MRKTLAELGVARPWMPNEGLSAFSGEGVGYASAPPSPSFAPAVFPCREGRHPGGLPKLPWKIVECNVHCREVSRNATRKRPAPCERKTHFALFKGERPI